jgi:hypothetical protein
VLRYLIAIYSASVITCITLIILGVPMIAIFLMLVGWVGGFTFVFILNNLLNRSGRDALTGRRVSQ